jgi:dTDP-4-amino-4,6-dideoxygalactose transaminase
VNENTREYAKQLLSLPMHPFMTRDDVVKVTDILNGI